MKHLDVINFDTTKVNNYENMFYNAYSLTSLNLSNFIIYENTNINNMIYNLKSDIILCYYESQVTAGFKTQASGYTNNCAYICELESRIFITEVEKCVENCYSSGTDYLYEYQRKCYTGCPSKTKFYSDTKVCEDCRDYYNYEQTGCIDTIPDGFYNNNPTAKTIDKCPNECKTCTLDSVNNNLCTSCNVDGYYYYKEDDSSNRDSYYKCYHKDNVQTDYYLEDNIFKRCYSKCKTCSTAGDDNNNNCIECNDSDREVVSGNCICKNYYNYLKTACITSVPDGYYNDDTAARTIDECPTKCSKCSYSSIITNNNLCVSCNTGNGYHYKSDDSKNINSFYECY